MASTAGSTAHARIAFGALAVSAATVGVKLVVLAREMKVASAYGRGDQLDAFIMAALLPISIGTVIGGAAHHVLTPLFVRIRQADGEAEALALYGRAAAITLALGALGAVALAVSAPWLLPVLAGRFSPEKLQHCERLLYALLPLCLTGTLFPLLAAALHAEGRFALAALTPIATPAATVIAIRLGSGATAVPLLAGALVGAVIECSLLLIALPRPLKSALARPWAATVRMREYIAQLWPVLAALGFQLATAIIDQSFAAHLASGSVAALGYATRIVGLPMGVAAAALGTAVLPVLGSLAGATPEHFWQTLHWWQRRVLWCGLGASLVLMAVIHPVVRLALQRGNFGAGDTALVSAMVCAMVGAVPFYVVAVIGLKAMSALGANRAQLWIAAVNLAVDVAANLVLAPTYGVLGVACVTTIVYVVSCALVQMVLARHRRAAVPGTAQAVPA
jgi:putative peptidoglycan lipid II flippase